MKKILFLPLAILCAGHPALATPIAYEGFNYVAAVSLTGQTGGTGWANPWTISGTGSTVGTPGLSYTDSSNHVLPVEGNTGSFAGGNNGNFRMPTSTPETVGSSLYISFIAVMNSTAAASYAGFSLFNGGTETMFLGDTNAPTTWGIDPKGGTVINGTTPVSTKTFLVYRIDFLAASAEVRLFENPQLGSEPLSTSATAFATRTSALVWDTVRIQSNHLGSIDEVRIGTTYADVAPVPEPATTGLLALGGIALALRRRR